MNGGSIHVFEIRFLMRASAGERRRIRRNSLPRSTQFPSLRSTSMHRASSIRPEMRGG
jgi:hypothetical protein